MFSSWTCDLGKVIDYEFKLRNHCKFWIAYWTIDTYHVLVQFVLRFFFGQFSVTSCLAIILRFASRDYAIRKRVTLFILPRNIIRQEKSIVQQFTAAVNSDVCIADNIRVFWRGNPADMPPKPSNMQQVWLVYSSLIRQGLILVFYGSQIGQQCDRIDPD